LMLMTRHTPQSWWRILTDYLYSCCGSIWNSCRNFV
jgi:hypothetical protein